MTMYNEDEVLFVKTMNAVIKNIAHLCSRGRSKTWGPDGWKKVVVCIVSDGRSKINKRTLHVLSLMGLYQEGIAKDSIAGKDVTAHIFEYTSSVVVTDAGEVAQGSCPVQIIFCLKEQNKKKLNSHRWFFNAFGPLVNPNVCVLLDVGTKPTTVDSPLTHTPRDRQKSYGLLDLWVMGKGFGRCLAYWDGQVAMGYGCLWHTRGMGYGRVDCTKGDRNGADTP